MILEKKLIFNIMHFTKLLFLICLTFVSFVSAKEPKYITVFNDDKNTIWYRDDVIAKDGNVSLIMGVLLKKTAQMGIYNTEYNCASRSWITNSGKMMDRDGSVIYEQKERDLSWQLVAPNSTYERILNTVCRK